MICLVAIGGWIREYLAAGYDVIQFQSQICDERMQKGRTYTLKSAQLPGGKGSAWVGSNQSFAARVYSSRLFNNTVVRFMPGLKYSEDKIFLLTTNIFAKTIIQVPHVMYLYRMVSDSAMHTRKQGIEYYAPIVDAYIYFDENMHNAGVETIHGRIAASVYIMEAIREHLEFGGTTQDAEKFLEKYKYIMADTQIPENKEYINYTKNKRKCVLKYRMVGYGKKIASVIMRVIDKVRI